MRNDFDEGLKQKIQTRENNSVDRNPVKIIAHYWSASWTMTGFNEDPDMCECFKCKT